MAQDFTTKERILVPGGLIDELSFESKQNEEELQEIIYKIYELTRRTHPDREGDLPALLRNYRGREQELLSKLIKKPDLLLKLKKSYEPRRNHVPLSKSVIQTATSRLETEANKKEELDQQGQDSSNKVQDGSSGVDLFASFRDSLMFESESGVAPIDQVSNNESKEGDNTKQKTQTNKQPNKEGLSNLMMGVFSSTDNKNSNDKEGAKGNEQQYDSDGELEGNSSRSKDVASQKIMSRPRRLSVEQVAAGEVESPSPSTPSSRTTRSGSIFNSMIGMLDHETPFSMLSESQKKERLEARELSSYIADPSLDTSSDSSWIKVKDRVECFRDLDTLSQRAELLETLNLDDAVLVLVELKLRGDYGDVIGAVKGKGALGAIRQKAKLASENVPPQLGAPVNKKAKGLKLLPPETAQIIACTNESQLAKVLAGIQLLRAAALLLELRRRGSSGGVLDCLTAGGLAAILTHLPPPERAALLVTMSPAKCSDVLKAMSIDDQAMALSEMSKDEKMVAMSSLSRQEQEAANEATSAFMEKEAKREAKKLKKAKKENGGAPFGSFNIFGKKEEGKEEENDGSDHANNLINSTMIGMRAKRRQSNAETLNRFATNASRRATQKQFEKNQLKAKEARENATRARAKSAAATQALQTASESTPSKKLKNHQNYLANLLAEANRADDEAKEAEELANKLEEEERKNNGDSDDDDEEEDDDGILNSVTSLFGANTIFTEAKNEMSNVANQANEASSVMKTQAMAGVSAVGDATGGVVGNASASLGQVASKATQEANSMAEGLSKVSSQAASGLDDAVALPSWARAEGEGGGEGDEDEDGGSNDDEGGSNDGKEDDRGSVVSDVVSDATTDLDGISERGAGDGDILDSMVWSYLMSGLPAEEQAKYEAMNDDQRRAAMGLAATRATAHRQQQGGKTGGGIMDGNFVGGGVAGVDFSNMTSGEAAVAAKRLREAAESAKKREQEENASKPWNQFNSLFTSSPTLFDPTLPLPPPDALHPSDTQPPQSSAFDSFASWLPDKIEMGGDLQTGLMMGMTKDQATTSEEGGIKKGEEKSNTGGSVGFGSLLANVRSSFSNNGSTNLLGASPPTLALMGSDAHLRSTLAQHEEACSRAIATKRSMNRAVREQDETYLEDETPPEPLVEPSSLIGYTDTDMKAQKLFSAQDAKILSSKWGISVSEIKILAAQLALCTSDNGVVDPRLVPFLMNRLGYFDTLDMGIIPPQAKPQEIKGGGKDAVTWRLPANGASLKVLTPVDFADIFGKSALALAESDKPSPPTAGDMAFRVNFHTAIEKGVSKDKILAKDALAGISTTSDARLANYLFVFNEMCKGSSPCETVLPGYGGTRLAMMETRLLGRALRRVGCGKPNAIQAKMISKIVGVRIAMPEAIASQLGWLKDGESTVETNEEEGGNGNTVQFANTAAATDQHDTNPSHTGLFEFLACVSVMLRFEDSNIDTSRLINGDDGDEGVSSADAKQRAMFASRLSGSKLNETVLKAMEKSNQLSKRIAERVEQEAHMTKTYDDVDHGFGGGQLLLLSHLFEAFSEEFNLHRKTIKVVNKGLRSLLRAIGVLPLESQLRAIRTRYGDLGLNLHLDQFFLLCSDIHHWFPVATPRRILVLAGKISVNFGLGLSSSSGSGRGGSGSQVDGSNNQEEMVALSVVSDSKKSFASRSSLTARASFLKQKEDVEANANDKGALTRPSQDAATALQKANSSSSASQHFVIGDVYKLEHAFAIYDYDRDGVVGQLALRALLRRLHVNWSAKQFVRVTAGALGATWPDYDVDDFVTLLASTSAVMVSNKLEKKEGQPGRRVANHHAKILYSHFSVIWNLPSPQILLIQRVFLAEELKTNMYGGDGESENGVSALPEGYSEMTTVPRSSIRGILAKLGINYARVEASGLSESFDVNGHNAHGHANGNSVDFDELLGIIAHVVHLYGYVGDGHVDDPLSNLKDEEVKEARRAFFALAIDPQTGKAPAKHCLVALRQMKLVKTDMELDRCLRLSGTMPQYRANWLSWPSFIRLLAQLNYQKMKDDRLLRNKKVEVYPNFKPKKSKQAEVSDIDKLRSELSGFINQHNDFENYMERLNHTYKILQNESSQIVPARPAEPEEAPISKKEQRNITSAMSFRSRSNVGSGSFSQGKPGGMSFMGRSNSFGFKRSNSSLKKSKGTNSFGSEASWGGGSDQGEGRDSFALDKEADVGSKGMKGMNSDADFRSAKGRPGGGYGREGSAESVGSDVFNWNDA